MGTRHLIAVQLDGKYPVAQYGQWDGYPSGQGIGVLKFLHTMNREKFITGVNATYQPTDEQVRDWQLAAGADPKSLDEGFIDFRSAKRFGQSFPSLSRDTGAEVLSLIQNSVKDDEIEAIPLRNSISFAGDSLFCEFAYVIDLDRNTFEIFKGFNKEPLSEGDRFFGVNSGDEVRAGDNYQPVKLIKSYPLDALPTDEQFRADLKPQDEEDDEDGTTALPAPAAALPAPIEE